MDSVLHDLNAITSNELDIDPRCFGTSGTYSSSEFWKDPEGWELQFLGISD